MNSTLFHSEISFFVIFFQYSHSVEQSLSQAAGGGQADSDRRLSQRRHIAAGLFQCKKVTMQPLYPILQGTMGNNFKHHHSIGNFNVMSL